MKRIRDKKSYIRFYESKTRHNKLRRFKVHTYKSYIGRIFNKKSHEKRKSYKEFGLNRFCAPANFSLINNTDQVVKFIKRIETFYKERKKLYISLKKVELIDYSAITILLSVMNRFYTAGISFNGSFSDKKEVNDVIVKSGFLDRLKSNHFKGCDYNIRINDQIIGDTGNKTTNKETIIKIVKDVSNTLTDSDDYVFTALYPIMLELQQNTHEHAGKIEGSINWWTSINHDHKNKMVTFHFIDYGCGIIESLLNKDNIKILKEFKELSWKLFNNGQYSQILQSLLDGKYNGRYYKKNYNRGKGIPSLKSSFINKGIQKLLIITNKAYIDLENNIKKDLNVDFNGTYIMWAIDNKCNKKTWREK